MLCYVETDETKRVFFYFYLIFYFKLSESSLHLQRARNNMSFLVALEKLRGFCLKLSLVALN